MAFFQKLWHVLILGRSANAARPLGRGGKEEDNYQVRLEGGGESHLLNLELLCEYSMWFRNCYSPDSPFLAHSEDRKSDCAACELRFPFPILPDGTQVSRQTMRDVETLLGGLKDYENFEGCGDSAEQLLVEEEEIEVILGGISRGEISSTEDREKLYSKLRGGLISLHDKTGREIPLYTKMMNENSAGGYHKNNVSDRDKQRANRVFDLVYNLSGDEVDTRCERISSSTLSELLGDLDRNFPIENAKLKKYLKMDKSNSFELSEQISQRLLNDALQFLQNDIKENVRLEHILTDRDTVSKFTDRVLLLLAAVRPAFSRHSITVRKCKVDPPAGWNWGDEVELYSQPGQEKERISKSWTLRQENVCDCYIRFKPFCCDYSFLTEIFTIFDQEVWNCRECVRLAAFFGYHGIRTAMYDFSRPGRLIFEALDNSMELKHGPRGLFTYYPSGRAGTSIDDVKPFIVSLPMEYLEPKKAVNVADPTVDVSVAQDSEESTSNKVTTVYNPIAFRKSAVCVWLANLKNDWERIRNLKNIVEQLSFHECVARAIAEASFTFFKFLIEESDSD